MEYATKNGTVLTDKALDDMAQEYEKGTWQGTLGSVTMGRPKLYDEELETISFRLPKSRIAAIDEAAKRRGESKSAFLRAAVEQHLRDVDQPRS
ncbi:ribbon-helix-helix protein, CopG family [Eggerthella sinensis]|uniref:ribbon-helix-helix protein, CopG family n=1 Tax=Eggerthella sinensis TaxID=242230 RepID=UPI001D068571|nr:ribbon-helix-helix protein, CopG family [Eggerthella sinensis]MCB7038515.1 ribbon-helix-helix domain-containing protein [Eggerthella sinensis]